MSREEPRSRAEAWTYQLEDDVKVLRVCSRLPDKKPFGDALQNLKNRIDLYFELENGPLHVRTDHIEKGEMVTKTI
jgi:hypothetical protein